MGVVVVIVLLVAVVASFFITQAGALKSYNQFKTDLQAHISQMNDLAGEGTDILDKFPKDSEGDSEWNELTNLIKQSDELNSTSDVVLKKYRFGSSGAATELQKFDVQVSNMIQKMKTASETANKRVEIDEYNVLVDKLRDVLTDATKAYVDSQNYVTQNERRQLFEATQTGQDLVRSEASDDEKIANKNAITKQINDSIEEITSLADKVRSKTESAKKRQGGSVTQTPRNEN